MRSHELLPHTSDVGFRAVAADPRGLFEEAATALAELSADADPGVGPSAWHRVELAADDLPGLAFAWLNELISLADLQHAAIREATVERLDRSGDGSREPCVDRGRDGDGGPGPWRLSARLGLRKFSEGGLRPRLGLKSATYHGLLAQRVGAAWEMQAILDV
jgi:SHS2 domain-containing protein